jgi:hypothetical protein
MGTGPAFPPSGLTCDLRPAMPLFAGTKIVPLQFQEAVQP